MGKTCTCEGNRGRSVEIKPKKIGEKFFYRLLFTGKPVDGRFRCYDVQEILERDKTSLDIFWIKDKSLADLDNLPEPDVLASDIIENLQSALESFQELQSQIGK